MYIWLNDKSKPCGVVCATDGVQTIHVLTMGQIVRNIRQMCSMMVLVCGTLYQFIYETLRRIIVLIKNNGFFANSTL